MFGGIIDLNVHADFVMEGGKDVFKGGDRQFFVAGMLADGDLSCVEILKKENLVW